MLREILPDAADVTEQKSAESIKNLDR